MIVRVKADSGCESGEQEQAIAAANPATDGERGSVVPQQRRRGAHAAHAGGDGAGLGTPIWSAQPERSPVPAAAKVACATEPMPLGRSGLGRLRGPVVDDGLRVPARRGRVAGAAVALRVPAAPSASTVAQPTPSFTHICRKSRPLRALVSRPRSGMWPCTRAPSCLHLCLHRRELNDAAVAPNARRAKISTIARPRRQS